ncbi:acyl carrier protein [Deltaproteobacteria bacterium PRO3]|nr:acyl carrier protein [Deltaproteobacteria bacterium PRO3]
MVLKNEVLNLLQEVAPEVDPEKLDLDLPLRDQVDIDSMDFLNFLGRIYETLGVNVPESDYASLRSLNDLLQYLEKKRGGAP